MEHYGQVNASSTVRIFFTTHDKDGGAVAPSSGFEAADVRIYKDGSATQRSSEAGYTMTSPFDSVTGLHLLSVDLSDNTDSGFYAAGSRYTVVLVPNDETIDSETPLRVLADFTIGPVAANVTQFGSTAGTFSGGRPEVNTTLIEGSVATNQIRDAVVDDATRIDASALNTLSGHDPGETIMGATDLGTGAGLTSLASAANLATVAGYVDTEVAAIKAKTDNLPSDPADASVVAGLIAGVEAKVDTVDSNVDAIKAVTDALLDKLGVVYGTAAGAGTGADTLQLETGQVTAAGGDGSLDDKIVSIVAGAGKGQNRAILATDESDNEIQIDGGAWEVAVDNTSVFIIYSN